MQAQDHSENTLDLRGRLLRGILGFTLLWPAALWGGPKTILVPKPTGGDDTVILQKALDDAVAHGPGAIVQLAAGTYLTKQLVAYNFHGTFQGVDQHATTIEAQPHLPVLTDSSFTANWPMPSADCHWPCLITFVDGNIRISNLSIKITAANGTATTGFINPTFNRVEYGLYDAILFMGKDPTNVSIDHVAIEGVQDGSGWGFNLAMGVDYSSYYPASTTVGDFHFLRGNLTIQNSSFSNMWDCVSFDGRHKDNHVVIGGTPSTGNVFEKAYLALDLEPAEDSAFEISFNQASGYAYAMWIYNLFTPNFVPATPSHYLIHDNTFSSTGPTAECLFLMDDPASPWIRASIFNNRIESKNHFTDGILLVNTANTSIRNNVFTGSGRDAILLAGTTQAKVLDNDFSGFVAGWVDVTLTPTSTRNLIFCASPSDTVLDQGVDNRIFRVGVAKADPPPMDVPAGRPALPETIPHH